MRHVYSTVNYPNQSTTQDTPPSNFAKIYAKDGVLFILNDLGEEELVSLKPDSFDGSDDFFVSDFVGNREFTRRGFFRTDARMTKTPVAGIGDDVGVLRLSLPITAATTSASYISTHAPTTRLVNIRHSLILETKLRILDSTNNIFIGFLTDTSIYRTGAIGPYGYYIDIINGSLYGRAGSSSPLITDSTYTISTNTAYTLRIYINEIDNIVTYQIFNPSDMSLIWEDMISTSISGGASSAITYTILPTAVPSEDLPILDIDYFGYGHLNGYYRTFGRLL